MLIKLIKKNVFLNYLRRLINNILENTSYNYLPTEFEWLELMTIELKNL